jgi:ABC-2 type transport system permease protein
MNWWRSVVAAEIRKILAYRSDFWVTFIGQTLVQVLVARALWENIFTASGKEIMEGFTLPMMTLYYLLVPIGNKILSGQNVGFLASEIYDGTFNRYLLYPISFFQYKTLTYLTYSVFYSIQLILIFLLYQTFIGTGLTTESLVHLGFGFIFFVIAAFAYGMIAMFIELISLWADNIWSLMVMCRFTVMFCGGGIVPLAFFPEKFQTILSYTPFPYLVSLPIRTTMGVATELEMRNGFLFLILWSIFFRMMAKALWNRGQYRYTGVGI